jgi:hypothetical protein
LIQGITDPLPPLTVVGFQELPPTPISPPIKLKTFHGTSAPAQHPVFELAVDSGYKIIGCGARANWRGYGSLLTALFPTDHNTCVAKAKDHKEADPASLDVWAIALYDPNNDWEVRIFSSNSAVEAHPHVTVAVDKAYRMVGGGAQVNYGGYGNMLTASYPFSFDTWSAESKDHIQSDPASVTVYAVGIKPSRAGLPLPQTQIFAQSSSLMAHPSQTVTVLDPFVLTCGGAYDQYRGQGNLLYASFPLDDGKNWAGSGKDHVESDPSVINVYAIGIASSGHSPTKEILEKLKSESH